MNGDPSILFVKPKAISTKDKEALHDAGVIVVEVDDPSAVKLVRPVAEIEGGEILRAAARAIATAGTLAGTAREIFAKELCEAIQAKAEGRAP
jgi:hypothetical protein